MLIYCLQHRNIELSVNLILSRSWAANKTCCNRTIILPSPALLHTGWSYRQIYIFIRSKGVYRIFIGVGYMQGTKYTINGNVGFSLEIMVNFQ